MHGHALSNTRKLNRHWQSAEKGTGLEENLVFFERELDVDDWEYDNSPYWIYYSEGSNNQYPSHEQYSKRNPVRNKWGFKPLVILQSGDYQVHWNLSTHKLQNYRDENDERRTKISAGNWDDRWGMFGVNMYGMGQWLNIATQSPDYIVDTGSEKYYVGHAENYIANGPDTALNDSPWYVNDDIVQKVSPSRTSTRSWLGGSSTLNMNSGQEEPELILHIGAGAPFPQYRYAQNDARQVVWFERYYQSFSPAIWFLFTTNVNGGFGVEGWAITGKIWLERIGDYTEGRRPWKAEILEAPEGYTILGDGGIIS